MLKKLHVAEWNCSVGFKSSAGSEQHLSHYTLNPFTETESHTVLFPQDVTAFKQLASQSAASVLCYLGTSTEAAYSS